MRSLLRIFALTVFIGAALCVLTPACDRYEPPPTVGIDGLQAGLLYDSKAPLVVTFGQAIDLATVSLKVATAETNLEGELADEDEDSDTELRVLVGHDPVEGDRGGRAELDPDGTVLRFIPDSALPVGPKLVLIVEAGLTGTNGRVRLTRTKIPFSYAVRCVKGTRAEKLKSGVYFFLLEVAQPLGTQIQLYGAIDVDPVSGAFIGQFTNADRNPDGSRCPGGCKEIDRCRLLPAPECGPPSAKAGTAEEYSDFVPNSEPPIGYSFPIEGCAIDDGEGAGVVTAPATMVVQSPPVTVEGLTMTAFFGLDASGKVRATGSLTADTVYLGTNKLGAGKGTMTSAFIPEAEIPPGVPRPVLKSAASDGGTAGGSDAGR